MRITTKGQVTIPQSIREQFGFRPHSEVDFVVVADHVELRAAVNPRRARMEQWIKQYRGSLKGGMTTDELMQLTRGEN
jgi:AbrB family looped-hinge helix DNA binding protein